MERASHSHRTVFVAFALSLGVAFVVALWIHQRFARYEPRTAAHVPEGPQVVLWLNVEQTVGFDLFKNVLLPVLERGRTGPEPRIKHLERKTSLELEVDTRELLYANWQDDGWLIVLGGLFRRDRVTEGVARWLDELGLAPAVRDRLVVASTGHAFGVAPDGVLVVSNRESLARAALAPASPRGPGQEQRSILTKPGTLLNLLVFPGGTFAGTSAMPRGAGRLWVSLEPGDPFPIFAQYRPARSGSPPLDVAAALVPFSPRTLRQTPAPASITHWQGEVTQDGLAEGMAHFQRKLNAVIWDGAFAGRGPGI